MIKTVIIYVKKKNFHNDINLLYGFSILVMRLIRFNIKESFFSGGGMP